MVRHAYRHVDLGVDGVFAIVRSAGAWIIIGRGVLASTETTADGVTTDGIVRSATVASDGTRQRRFGCSRAYNARKDGDSSGFVQLLEHLGLVKSIN